MLAVLDDDGVSAAEVLEFKCGFNPFVGSLVHVTVTVLNKSLKTFITTGKELRKVSDYEKERESY